MFGGMEVGSAKGSLVTCGGCCGGGASGMRMVLPNDCMAPGMGAPVTGLAPALEEAVWARAASPDHIKLGKIKTAKSLFMAR